MWHATLLAKTLTTAQGHFVEQAQLLARAELRFMPQRFIQTLIVSHDGCPVSATDAQ